MLWDEYWDNYSKKSSITELPVIYRKAVVNICINL
jgi:hypothetical protein